MRNLLDRTARATVLLVAALALVACAPAPATTPPSASASPTATPTPTPTPEPVASTVVISLDTLSVLDQFGAELRSASFADAAAVVALVGDLVGSAPVVVDNGKFGIWYQWPEIEFRENYFSWLIVTTPTLGGLPLTTSTGIHIGSTRADVEAAGGVSLGPDTFALDLRPNPERQNPAGGEGSDYFFIGVENDIVTEILAPWGDWQEV